MYCGCNISTFTIAIMMFIRKGAHCVMTCPCNVTSVRIHSYVGVSFYVLLVYI